jgi:hypothetical protein
MPSERRFRDDGTKATRFYKPNNDDDRMNENDEDVVHAGIVSKSQKLPEFRAILEFATDRISTRLRHLVFLASTGLNAPTTTLPSLVPTAMSGSKRAAYWAQSESYERQEHQSQEKAKRFEITFPLSRRNRQITAGCVDISRLPLLRVACGGFDQFYGKPTNRRREGWTNGRSEPIPAANRSCCIFMNRE